MYKIYIIEYGENLSDIAKKFNTSVDLLEKINGPLYNLVPGMQIVVPSSAETTFQVYTVQKGDSLYEISRKYNITLQDLILINGLDKNDYIYPGQQLLIPKEGYGVYITVNDDTLNTVAGKLNKKVGDIINENASIYLMPEQLIIYKKEKSS